MSKIALFGATGQLGTAILNTLLTDPTLTIIQLIPPATTSQPQVRPETTQLSTRTVDVTTISRGDLARELRGVDVVISTLNGKKALEAQAVIQDAAWDAGVRRFFPSEFGLGMVYRLPGDEYGYGYLHPIWNTKQLCTEKATHHPAITFGDMTYTLIGCGDLYNQPREKTWCPWTQTSPSDNSPEYTLHIVGSPTPKADFTHTADLAAYVLETIRHPELSENRTLNFVSDHLSYEDIAVLLERYSGRAVRRNVMPVEVMHRVLKNPGEAPREVKEGPSSFPVDFWFLVKGLQGEGRFWRARGEVHNGLFPGVRVRTFEGYLRELFGV